MLGGKGVVGRSSACGPFSSSSSSSSSSGSLHKSEVYRRRTPVTFTRVKHTGYSRELRYQVEM